MSTLALRGSSRARRRGSDVHLTRDGTPPSADIPRAIVKAVTIRVTNPVVILIRGWPPSGYGSALFTRHAERGRVSCGSVVA